MGSIETISTPVCVCWMQLREIYPFVGRDASRHFYDQMLDLKIGRKRRRAEARRLLGGSGLLFKS